MKNKLDQSTKSSLINMFIKPISMVLSLVYTPLLLNYLSDEKYGLWATLLSITSWMTYCDVGIGHGLRNVLTKYIAQDDYDNAGKAVSTAYVCLTAISSVIFIVLLIGSCFANWNSVFNTEIDMKWPVLITFSFICINFVLSLSNTILYALQKSELVSIRSVYTQVINIIGIILLNIVSDQNLVYVSVLFGGSSLVVYVYNTIKIIKKYRYCAPRARKFDRNKIHDICNLGLKFFIIQISGVALYTIDNMLITRYFGAAEVTPYSMVDRVFQTGYGVYSAMILPFWSASTLAITKQDFGWFKEKLRKLNIMTFIFIIGYILVGVCFRPLVGIWLQRDLDYPAGLIPIMVIYYSIYTFASPYCSFNNGIGAINEQVILGVIQAALNIPLSIFLGVNCGLGVLGIKMATTILISVNAVFHPIYYHVSIKKMMKSTYYRGE